MIKHKDDVGTMLKRHKVAVNELRNYKNASVHQRSKILAQPSSSDSWCKTKRKTLFLCRNVNV